MSTYPSRSSLHLTCCPMAPFSPVPVSWSVSTLQRYIYAMNMFTADRSLLVELLDAFWRNIIRSWWKRRSMVWRNSKWFGLLFGHLTEFSRKRKPSIVRACCLTKYKARWLWSAFFLGLLKQSTDGSQIEEKLDIAIVVCNKNIEVFETKIKAIVVFHSLFSAYVVSGSKVRHRKSSAGKAAGKIVENGGKRRSRPTAQAGSPSLYPLTSF